MIVSIDSQDIAVRHSSPEAVAQRCSVKKSVLRNFAKFTGMHLCQSLFFNKVSLAQVFSCEFCEISENTLFYRTLPVAASASLCELLTS